MTGSNRGLGLAFVCELLERGATKVYAGVRDMGTVDILPKDSRIVPIRIDLEDYQSITNAARFASDVNLLINNAAYAAFSPPLSVDRQDVHREARVNYLGTYDMIDAFSPVLASTRGDCVVVLSKLALISAPRMAGYSAGKAALHSMVESLRPVLASNGVSLFAAYPGGIDTDMLSHVSGAKSRPATVAKNILDAVDRSETPIYPDPESAHFARSRQSVRL